MDACMYRNDSKVFDKVVCEAIEGFARECEQVGFPLDWRKISKCGKEVIIVVTYHQRLNIVKSFKIFNIIHSVLALFNRVLI